MMYTSNLLHGARIRLTAPHPSDAAVISGWYHDSAFARLYDANPAYPRTEAVVARWLDGGRESKDSFQFAIRLLDRDDLLGYTDLDGIQWTHRCAWLSIAIGDPAYRGLGYGTEAMGLLLRFAFHELNLHRVQLTVFSYNERAIRLYERIGFKREGVYREALLRDGQYHHLYLYGLLSREWGEANP